MTISYRQGTMEDSHTVFQIFVRTLMDYGDRMNVTAITGGDDPEVLESLWQQRQPMFEFLAKTASRFWVAERDGEIVAYARSIEHNGMQELTEFFVVPDQQSAGLGAGLLSRAFPESGARFRTIIATLDERALYRYMKAGVYGRFPLKYFYRKAEKVDMQTDLQVDPLDLNLHTQDINRIDREILAHTREPVHTWIASRRQGFVYKHNGTITGYGYVGGGNGPFAVLDDSDFPAVLAHAESLMADQGKEFGAEVPLINTRAVQYFVERKYKIDSFSTIFMSNIPFGRFENYLCFSPEFFM
ncbi:MAG TPA: GNAT family N-acetyltransferase [Anaerolineales bacterium]|nr:GNAT family N-acetyltransferase [Anaerolineales bacterium]